MQQFCKSILHFANICFTAAAVVDGNAINGDEAPKGIMLKIQSSLWKNPLLISIEMDSKLKILIIKCAEDLKCSPEKLKLR